MLRGLALTCARNAQPHNHLQKVHLRYFSFFFVLMLIKIHNIITLIRFDDEYACYDWIILSPHSLIRFLCLELCIDRPFCTNYNFVLYPNLCQRLAIYCRKSCDFCGGIRTVQPIKKITPIARRITPSTTKPPSPKTTTTTSPKTMNTAAVQTKVTRTSTKLLPNGGNFSLLLYNSS